MKYTLTEDKPCKRVFKVELDGAEHGKARAEAFAYVSARVDLPGFRPGKVPAQVLQQRFGKQLEEETIERVIGFGARAVLAGTKLEPVTNPSVTGITRAGEGLSFLLTIELAPVVSLGEYRGLSFTREKVIIRAEDVDSVIERLRRRMTSYSAAERPARWGDLAVIDYDGAIDGAPFEDSSSRDVLVFIGSGEAMRELEEQLVGRKSGEAFAVRAVFPSDHANQALAGKAADLSVTLKELKAPKLPDLDDEFAKSAADCRGVEDLRRTVTDRLRQDKERETATRLRAQVVDRLLRFAPPEVAPSLVEEEMNYMTVRGAEELARQGVKRIEQLRMDARQFRDLFRPASVRAVREAFVLEAIAGKEGISVEDADLEREIREGRKDAKESPDRLLASLKSGGRWERLKQRLRQDRTLDWVINHADVTELALSL